ncbi:hypothetical protein PRIPAC_88355, partial [Pristionchus pacificus]
MLRLLFASASDCTQAQMDTIVNCYAAFHASYGAAFPPLNPDYFEGFHRQRSDMQKEQGISAKPAIQQYGAALTECLKPVADCIVDSTFNKAPLSATVDNGDGHRYNLDRVQTAYECTEPGYSFQMRHFFCIDHFKALPTDSPDPSRQLLTQCNADFKAITDPATNPTDDVLCKAYQDNARCYGQVYSDYCGATEVSSIPTLAPLAPLEFEHLPLSSSGRRILLY